MRSEWVKGFSVDEKEVPGRGGHELTVRGSSTYHIRDRLKAVGYQWDPDRRYWWKNTADPNQFDCLVELLRTFNPQMKRFEEQPAAQEALSQPSQLSQHSQQSQPSQLHTPMQPFAPPHTPPFTPPQLPPPLAQYTPSRYPSPPPSQPRFDPVPSQAPFQPSPPVPEQTVPQQKAGGLQACHATASHYTPQPLPPPAVAVGGSSYAAAMPATPDRPAAGVRPLASPPEAQPRSPQFMPLRLSFATPPQKLSFQAHTPQYSSPVRSQPQSQAQAQPPPQISRYTNGPQGAIFPPGGGGAASGTQPGGSQPWTPHQDFPGPSSQLGNYPPGTPAQGVSPPLAPHSAPWGVQSQQTVYTTAPAYQQQQHQQQQYASSSQQYGSGPLLQPAMAHAPPAPAPGSQPLPDPEERSPKRPRLEAAAVAASPILDPELVAEEVIHGFTLQEWLVWPQPPSPTHSPPHTPQKELLVVKCSRTPLIKDDLKQRGFQWRRDGQRAGWWRRGSVDDAVLWGDTAGLLGAFDPATGKIEESVLSQLPQASQASWVGEGPGAQASAAPAAGTSAAGTPAAAAAAAAVLPLTPAFSQGEGSLRSASQTAGHGSWQPQNPNQAAGHGSWQPQNPNQAAGHGSWQPQNTNRNLSQGFAQVQEVDRRVSQQPGQSMQASQASSQPPNQQEHLSAMSGLGRHETQSFDRSSGPERSGFDQAVSHPESGNGSIQNLNGGTPFQLQQHQQGGINLLNQHLSQGSGNWDRGGSGNLLNQPLRQGSLLLQHGGSGNLLNQHVSQGSGNLQHAESGNHLNQYVSHGSGQLQHAGARNLLNQQLSQGSGIVQRTGSSNLPQLHSSPISGQPHYQVAAAQLPHNQPAAGSTRGTPLAHDAAIQDHFESTQLAPPLSLPECSQPTSQLPAQCSQGAAADTHPAAHAQDMMGTPPLHYNSKQQQQHMSPNQQQPQQYQPPVPPQPAQQQQPLQTAAAPPPVIAPKIEVKCEERVQQPGPLRTQQAQQQPLQAAAVAPPAIVPKIEVKCEEGVQAQGPLHTQQPQQPQQQQQQQPPGADAHHAGASTSQAVAVPADPPTVYPYLVRHENIESFTLEEWAEEGGSRTLVAPKGRSYAIKDFLKPLGYGWDPQRGWCKVIHDLDQVNPLWDETTMIMRGYDPRTKQVDLARGLQPMARTIDITLNGRDSGVRAVVNEDGTMVLEGAVLAPFHLMLQEILQFKRTHEGDGMAAAAAAAAAGARAQPVQHKWVSKAPLMRTEQDYVVAAVRHRLSRRGGFEGDKQPLPRTEEISFPEGLMRRDSLGNLLKGPAIVRNGEPHNRGRMYFSSYCKQPGVRDTFIWADGTSMFGPQAMARCGDFHGDAGCVVM